MPVRKIRKNYLVVTGGFASNRNERMLGFESPLEKDLHMLLEYDPDVRSFEEQPVKIAYKLASGRRSPGYTPDILIQYCDKNRKPVLGEVKPQSYLDHHADEYVLKFAAAKLYAKERGWKFRTFTEHDIRTPRLANYKFFREYHSTEASAADMEKVAALLRPTDPPPTYETFASRCRSELELLELIPVLWHMVAMGCIAIDLDTAISGTTYLELVE